MVRSLDPDAGDSLAGMTDTAVAGNTVQARAQSTSKEEIAATGDTQRPSKPELGADLVGVTLAGRYLVTKKVGQGGMGAVYEATHTLIGKRVAVKVLLEKYAKRNAIVQRLEQEAKLASSVGNEHIIDITDFGQTEDGRTFVVMEFLEGESLAECLSRETKLPEQRILRLAAQTAAALAAAHDKGVVHRDIKPENLFLLKRKDTDFVKVLDFGISKSLRSSGPGDEEEAPRLTQTGMVLGTPLYMSPEQARGDDTLDHRVDIYALGVIMYEAATGRVPFAGNNYLSVISQVLNEDPTAPRELRPELSEEFEAIVQRAMAKDRTDRYANARDLASDLNALVDDPTRSTERAKITGPRKKPALGRKSGAKILGWVAGVAVLVAAIVVIVTVAMGGNKPPEKIVEKPVVAPPPPVIDAAVAPPVDATPLLTYTFHTNPPGGTILRDDEEFGVDGQVPILKENKEVVIRAEKGELVGELKFNPAETDKLEHTITLHKKTKEEAAQPVVPHGTGKPSPRAGSAAGSGAGSGKASVPVRGDGTMPVNPFSH